MILRPYQDRLYYGLLREARAGHKAILAVLPTGGGKTVVASALMQNCLEKGRKAWFICHRDFLIDQTSGTMTQFGLGHGFIAAGRAEGVTDAMCVSVDTLRSRLHRTTVRPDLVIWDEAHHSRAESWQRVWDWFGPGVVHVGLTATPQRLDGRGLGPVAGKAGGFTAMVEGPTTAELMRLGMLSGYRAFAPGKIDLTGVRSVGGDYDPHQLSEAVEKSVIVGDVVQHYRDRAAGLRAVYFAVNIGFSKRLAQAFSAGGIPAVHIDGTTPSIERVAAARALATGRVKVLVNCAILGEGFDLAAVAGMDCNIEAVGLVRPTQSLALHLQQIGRALRPKAQPAVILDHAGNVHQHGLPDDERFWTLDGKKKNAARKTTVKTCEACLGVSPINATVCVCCGQPFVKTPRLGPDHVDGQLVEIDPKERARRMMQEVADARSLAELQAIGRRRGYKPGWAYHVFEAKKAASQRPFRRPASHDAVVLPFKRGR
jgi:superfamily II DNA or RNA helicase